MNAVKISELRQNLPAFVARARDGERIGVSVHGKVIAELVPAPDRQAEAKRYLAKLRQDMKKRGVEIGDIITPIDYEFTSDWDNIQKLERELGPLKPLRKRR